MSRKDYKKVAEIISALRNDDRVMASEVLSKIQGELANMFKSDNPNFNYQKFNEACQ